MNTINNDIDETLKEIALKGIAARNKANKVYKQKVLSTKKPHEDDPDNPRKKKEEEKINQSIQKFLLRRERLSEHLKQKRLEAGKQRGRPFKYPENQLKKEETLRQLNELRELKIVEKQISELSELERIEIQIQRLLTLKQDILNKNEMNKTTEFDNNDIC